MTPEQKTNLKRLFQPRHVAVIGGTDAVTVATECHRIGYSGPFWPVNPKRKALVVIAVMPLLMTCLNRQMPVLSQCQSMQRLKAWQNLMPWVRVERLSIPLVW